jgi:hypothetical protein
MATRIGQIAPCPSVGCATRSRYGNARAAASRRVEARSSAREQNVGSRGSAREQNVGSRGSAREQNVGSRA